jgi:hypothetical protein
MYCKCLTLHTHDMIFELLLILDASLSLVEGRFLRVEAIEAFVEVWGIPKFDFGARHIGGVSEM